MDGMDLHDAQNAPFDWAPAKRETESFADRVFTITSMTGAVCGAVVGVGVVGSVAAFMPAVVGMLGTVSGGLLGSAVGRYLILPVSDRFARRHEPRA